MLIKFKVKNFKSFKEKTEINMTATDIDEHKDSIIKTVNNNDLLSVATIYGANAAGKSNLISAMFIMIEFMIEGMKNTKEKSHKFDFINKKDDIYFSFEEDSYKNPTEFEIDFIYKGHEYKYGYTILDYRIIEEYAYERVLINDNYEHRLIFDRNVKDEEVEISEDLKDIESVINKCSDTKFILSLGNDFEIEPLENMFIWLNGIYFNYTVLNITNAYTQIKNNVGVLIGIDELPRLKKFLNSFEPSITNVIIEENEDGSKGDIKIERTVNGVKYIKSIECESLGTIKMITYYTLLNLCINENIPLVVDELDISIHPLLLRMIILTFHDETRNRGRSQLIATLHNTSILSKDLLRRDEVWFVSKDENLQSELYSLIELENSGESDDFTKQYMYGYYGGIPILKGFDVFE